MASHSETELLASSRTFTTSEAAAGSSLTGVPVFAFDFALAFVFARGFVCAVATARGISRGGAIEAAAIRQMDLSTS